MDHDDRQRREPPAGGAGSGRLALVARPSVDAQPATRRPRSRAARWVRQRTGIALVASLAMLATLDAGQIALSLTGSVTVRMQQSGAVRPSDPAGGDDRGAAGPQARSARELKSIIEAERSGAPLLLWRDAEGTQQILSLDGRERMTVGRRASNDVVLGNDGEVSRTHAELERIGEDWTVVDDGLSRNGTFLNGTRSAGRKRLHDGDELRFGRTVVEYRCPAEGSTALTSSAAFLPTVESLTDTQRKIVVALCRPYRAGAEFATPAPNSEIAAEVFLSVDAVKTHLRTLFQRFEIGDLPQNQKRARLVQCAFQWGLVSERDL